MQIQNQTLGVRDVSFFLFFLIHYIIFFLILLLSFPQSLQPSLIVINCLSWKQIQADASFLCPRLLLSPPGVDPINLVYCLPSPGA